MSRPTVVQVARRPSGGRLRRLASRMAVAALVIATAPFVGAGPAAASVGCQAMNGPEGDGFYYGKKITSDFRAGDVITLTANPPVSPSATNYVPTTFYIGVADFHEPAPTQTAAFPGTLVYTVPENLKSITVLWATYPEVPQGTTVSVTWTVSCQNAPKANPTLTTQASPSTMLGGPVSDTATLAGGSEPTGSIDFRLYGPGDATCAGPPVFQASTTVSGNGAYPSPSFTPQATGTYRWVAEYSGDEFNNPAVSPCNAPNESVEVTPFVPPPPTSTLTGDVTGPVTVGAGQSVLVEGARLLGPVTVQAGGALNLVNSRVTNGITATDPSFLSICGSQVSNPGVSVTGASVPIRIGDPAKGCAGNRVAGDVTLTGNTGGVAVGGNIVTGTLACSGNSPAPTNNGHANTAGVKTGQCIGL